MTPHLEVVPNGEWQGTVAAAWAERLANTPDLRMCLPSGATPRPVYKEMIDRVNFSASTVFLLDEFGLPDGDPARCDRMLRTDLLDRLDDPPAVFDRLNPNVADTSEECARYATAVARGLDLVLLGLGANGHLGLNEPGSTHDTVTRVVTLASETRRGLARYGSRSDTTWGMTLGLSEILAAREIWLLVNGSHKAEVLSRFTHDPIGPDLPATFLRTREIVVVWADEDAAAS